MIQTENELLTFVLMFPLTLAIWRMLRGPTFVDRIVALDMMTGLAVAIAALTAAVNQRREFLTVGLGVALISFVGTCAFAIFVERKGRDNS
ncbi:MAG: monovalent cation/H+ antiporter complex subunit F [Vicinamibacterales bacterium]